MMHVCTDAIGLSPTGFYLHRSHLKPTASSASDCCMASILPALGYPATMLGVCHGSPSDDTHTVGSVTNRQQKRVAAVGQGYRRIHMRDARCGMLHR